MTQDWPALWVKYGLTINLGASRDAWEFAADCHWMVSRYLEANPAAAALYRPDQTGELKYFNVLDLAEKERAEQFGVWPRSLTRHGKRLP